MDSNMGYKTNIVLGRFETCQLSNMVPQDKLLNYTGWLMATAICLKEKISSKEKAQEIFSETLEKIKNYGVSQDLIKQRQFLIVPNHLDEKATEKTVKLPLFHQNLFDNPNGDTINVRMNIFKEKALEAFEQFYSNKRSGPDDIIHVTCAGYLAPSPAQEYIVKRGWYNVQVTNAYHMGCYAAFPAVKMACGFISASHHSLSSPKNQVDIVHTEFLSTHFNINDTDAGNIVNMTLFGDGFIKYSAYTEDEFLQEQIPGLKIIANHEEIIPESLHEMTWIPGPYQFDMFLSKNVPILIGENIKLFVKNLCEKGGINFEEVKEELIYAIHPGGPKILNYIKDILEIKDEHIKYSKKIFFHNGNMSSATVPHIWKEIIESDDVSKNRLVITMGFGPGLIATGLLLQKL